ncbi:flavin-linked sulfhydryl oxidase KNAG_0D03880 [Huiozyma naganishii CBS 8797]|uniref:Sulfhydryl oxidase n=1 Tax=Huiozyma naganishii (strain ATCC MYA-139 / BCRC 22969 / CBS 8797 / KCTC 17520 / NBRC 10181 / NCYC 3082 / Yp74L-3) TaxID=1071383 RepID=J7S612_HUIN7|nr:hypothetical protein KNAG_0D03880 [Kazachstania naganishii CBS 8797]CCK70134.1 hypothetical protein KNAG_0D03880 [Kazachstania naganishii CBS 8797]
MDDSSISDSQGSDGIFFNKQGKFCIPCTAFRGFQYVAAGLRTRYENYKSNQGSSPTVIMNDNDKIPGSRSYLKEDPPDVQKLGVASWDFLHSMAAKYPDQPTVTQEGEMKEFLKIFSHVYPCHWCAKDFEKYIEKHAPRTKSKEDLSRWMCEAHNSVNGKLGKPKFDCNFWKQRWQDGWEDQQQSTVLEKQN